MPGRGLEPPRDCSHQLLRLACLPFHHPGFAQQFYIIFGKIGMTLTFYYYMQLF